MRWTALLPVLLAVAPAGCNDPVSSLPAPPPPPPPPTFSATDLAGDWNGLLHSANPLLKPVNLVMRFDPTGIPLEARDGRGNVWTAGVDTLTVTLAADGTFTASLALASGTRVLDLSGRINASTDLLKGTFVLTDPATGTLDSGTFDLDRTGGAGTFDIVTQLMGAWSGTATTTGSVVFTLKLTIGADGSVLGGRFDDVFFKVGGPNTGIFAFADDSLGTLENILIEAEDGSTLTIQRALVDQAGTSMSGLGTHSVQGDVQIRLSRR